MAGKKSSKRRAKNLGLSLPRIGASLLPDAVFTAVPSTVQGLAQTWPRKAKDISALESALGSIGNIAQAVVVASSPRRAVVDIVAETQGHMMSDESSDESDYYSEGHYAVVDDNMRRSMSAPEHIMQGSVGSPQPAEEVIYATVNKNRKPRQEIEDLETSSEDDITDVSGMNSDDDDSLSVVVHEPSASNMTEQHCSTRRKSSKRRRSPRHSKTEPVTEPIIKADINENFITAADIPDGLLADDDSTTQDKPAMALSKVDEVTSELEPSAVSTTLSRNYYEPSAFEKEEFVNDERTLEHYTLQESLPNLRRREIGPVGASAPDLTGTTEVLVARVEVPCDDILPEVPPVGRRETPIGKGQSSTESISMVGGERITEEMVLKRMTDQSPRHKWKKKSSKRKQKERHEHEMIEKSGTNETTQFGDQKGKHRLSVKEKLIESSEQLEAPRNTAPERDHGIRSEQEMNSKGRAPEFLQEPEPVLEVQDNEGQVKGQKRKEKRKSRRRELSEVAGEIRSKGAFKMATTQERESHDPMQPRRCKSEEDFVTKRSSKKHRDKGINVESEAVPVTSCLPAETLQQMSLAKETCRKLRQQVKILDQEKCALESLSESLNDENKTLKKLTQTLSNIPERGTSSVTSVSLVQLQNDELRNENSFLKDTLHRLNVELGRYQAKYRHLSPQEVDSVFQSGERQPAWLMDRKYLAPLLLAYDDRVKEKDDIITTYEVELQKFKSRLEEIVQENVELRENVDKAQMISHYNEECTQLEEQAKLVLEENAVLMERQEMQDSKMEEMKVIYKEEVSRLSKLLTSCESERDVLKSKLEVMNTSLHEVQQDLDSSSAEWKKRISVEEHVEIMNECQRKLETLKERTEEEIDSLKSQLKIVQTEKGNLASQLADYKLVNAQLEREIHKFNEIQRRNERRTLLLKEKLNHVCDRENTTQDTLSEVLKVAEKTSAERDFLNEMLVNQQSEKKKVESLVKREEDKLKEYQNEAHDKITAIKGRVKEQERVTERLRERYENEMNSLKVFIRHQQSQLEDMVNDKRNLETELNNIYENIGGEDKLTT